jgi:hypothetical protein
VSVGRPAFVKLVIASAVLNALALYFGRGWWVHMVGVLAAMAWIGAPALVIGAVLWVVGFRYPAARRSAMVAFVAGVVVASTIASVLVGQLVVSYDIARAKAYCETFIPAIEQYRRAHGTYPRDLRAIPQMAGSPPRLAGQGCQYTAVESGFTFTLLDPRRLMAFISYRDSERAWVEWD